MPNKRTEGEIIAQAPLTVVLGGQKYEVPLLVIKDSRIWRKKVAEALGAIPQYANITTDTPTEFAGAIDAMLAAMPDAVIDLFFEYAKGLNRDEIEAIATEAELAKAFEQVVEAAFPLAKSLAGAMTTISR